MSDLAHLLHAIANRQISAAHAATLMRQGFTPDQIMKSIFTPAIELPPDAEALWIGQIKAA